VKGVGKEAARVSAKGWALEKQTAMRQEAIREHRPTPHGNIPLELAEQMEDTDCRYTIEQMRQMGESVWSHRKPHDLNWLIDRDNDQSILLEKRHVDDRRNDVSKDDVLTRLSLAEKDRLAKELDQDAQRKRAGPKGTKVSVEMLFDIANRQGGLNGKVPQLPTAGIPAPPPQPKTSQKLSLNKMLDMEESSLDATAASFKEVPRTKRTPEQQAMDVRQQAVLAQQQAMMQQMAMMQQQAARRHQARGQMMAMYQWQMQQMQGFQPPAPSHFPGGWPVGY
jgi:hypothetical protein